MRKHYFREITDLTIYEKLLLIRQLTGPHENNHLRCAIWQ